MTDKKAGLRIRIEPELRKHFVQLCRSQDRPAAQVLREFMRRYVDEHANDDATKHRKHVASAKKKIEVV